MSFVLVVLTTDQLSRDDPAARTKNLLALCLAAYGVFIFIFWYVFECPGGRLGLTLHSLGFNIYQVLHPTSGQ